MRPATLLKKRIWHWCFPVNFAKFLRTPFLTKYLWWLLLIIWTLHFKQRSQPKRSIQFDAQVFLEEFQDLLVQCHFIASKLNAGCGGYLDKIYKILVDILDLKAVFYLRIFSYEATFFVRKQWKVGFDPTFFTSKKVANQWEFSKKSLCAKKVASEKLAYLMWILLKADFHLHVEYYVTWRSYSNDMIG